ncbi:MAG: DUF72 domain-containing protein [Gammaproteobacteria bacterium]|nr:DUF72 domain-containing protein [Gammaproteobacteria bacterium]
MQEQDYTAMIGATGWEHPAWQDNFYPEDLPEDWTFGYYSNEFPVVLITLSFLSSVEVDDIKEWLDECHENFRFIIELDAEITPLLLERIRLLDDKLMAVILERMQTLPAELSAVERFCRQSDQDCEQLMASGGGMVWDGKGTYCPAKHLALMELDSGDYEDMHDLKEVISQGQSALSEHQMMVILFKGTPPDLDTMRAARTICELLGL